MKKIIVSLVALCFLASFAAAEFSSIGFIDVQKVFKQYKATDKAQEELAKKEETFKKDFEKSQKTLAEAEKAGKTKDELEKMRKDLEEKLNPQREKLLKLNEELTTKLQLEILEAVKKVAKKSAVDLVLDKQVVITGGQDLTDYVITELNK